MHFTFNLYQYSACCTSYMLDVEKGNTEVELTMDTAMVSAMDGAIEIDGETLSIFVK